MTTQAPPTQKISGVATGGPPVALPEDPEQTVYPAAHAVVTPPTGEAVQIDSRTQTYHDGIYTLDGDVVILYQNRRIAADHVEYDSNTGEVTMTRRVVVTGGANQERVEASHGTYNLNTATGRFYDVLGSTGIRPATSSEHRTVYTTSSPFLFTGRVVVKTGPESYDVYDGTVTSCALPNPDWLLSAAHISIDDDTARAKASTFRLMNFPLLYLPYVTHPADPNARQSGILIPTIGESSSKGLVLGDQVYLVLDRSSDLTVGAEYYSNIGWAQNVTYRHKGMGLDFLKLHYAGVLDRRTASQNQGGEEVALAGRHDFSTQTRAATNVDYLSSYIYREAFSDNYNQAVTSDIVSTAYLMHEADGMELAVEGDRYQGIKVVGTVATQQQEVHLFHLPMLSFDSTEHQVPGTGNALSTGLEVSMELSGVGLKRTQPNFETGGIIERFDLHPQASYPIAIANWHIVPSLATRETFYTRSRAFGPTTVPGSPPKQSEASINRAVLEFALEIRPPALERTFTPTSLTRALGAELRHTIEPEITYRLADGVNNFRDFLRFDATDVVSNVDEVEYGVTQRLFRRAAARQEAAKGGPAQPCRTDAVAQEPGFSSDAPNSFDDEPMSLEPEADAPTGGQCPSEELISWRLTQRYFLDQTFGGAVVNGRRNIFTSTLDLTGVAFLTEKREISPLISRLRVRSSAHTDVEWDFDLDTGAKKFNSSNVYVDLHQGNAFGALSYARLDAPGRFFTENPTPTSDNPSQQGVTSLVSDFNQLRFLLGYGNPTKPGLSLAGNAGIDLKHLYGATSTSSSGTVSTAYPALLQYATVQASYNWNCCGLAVEYRKFELGSVRNEGTYRFNFTLANIGAAGNLRRAERLF